MKPDEFSAAVARTKLAPSGVAMARAHLVHGQPQAAIAAEYGVTQGRVSQACASIRRAARAGELRMVSVTVTVPHGSTGEVRALAFNLRQAAIDARRPRGKASDRASRKLGASDRRGREVAP